MCQVAESPPRLCRRNGAGLSLMRKLSQPYQRSRDVSSKEPHVQSVITVANAESGGPVVAVITSISLSFLAGKVGTLPHKVTKCLILKSRKVLLLWEALTRL